MVVRSGTAIARAAAYDRKGEIDRAIGDDDTALRLDPTLTDVLNARGELFRKKGDRVHALNWNGNARFPMSPFAIPTRPTRFRESGTT